MVQAVFCLNGDGTLIYEKDFGGGNSLSANDKIRISSTFHGLSTIAAQVAPVAPPDEAPLSFLRPANITVVDTDKFRIHCIQTLTQMKFFAVSSLTSKDVPEKLRAIYELYSDYVLKNPFYQMNMPIRCELFDQGVEKLFS